MTMLVCAGARPCGLVNATWCPGASLSASGLAISQSAPAAAVGVTVICAVAWPTEML